MVASAVVTKLHSMPAGVRLLDAVAATGEAWLVGGAVRDLLLGREPRELDVAVEGDVRPLAQALGGEVLLHEAFGTATVISGGDTFDLAQTRTETYAEPGALPQVTPATITEDLARRDVTVNAIAVALPSGRMVAAPGALEDLDARVLRVLHDASFTDDPTRVWRVARYAARLGFTVEPHTAALAAVAGPGAVSGERVGHELRLLLREDDPAAALAALAGLNPHVLPEGFEATPPALADALQLLPPDGRRDLLVLAACTGTMDLRLLQRWLDHLQFPAHDRDLVAAASRWVTGAPLRAAGTPSQIARAARGAPVEAVALAGGPNARRWIDELRHVRLEISGDDLLAAGIPAGPALGARLARTLDQVLDGAVGGREAQLTAALAPLE